MYFYIIYYIIYLNFFRNVSFGAGLRIRGPILFKVHKSSFVKIGYNFSLVSGGMINPIGRNVLSSLRVDEGAELIIGNNTGLSCVTIWSKRKIQIGNNVKVGADVVIMDSDMHSLDFFSRRDPSLDAFNSKAIEILIGDDVFVGTRSIISKGVVIGDRSIVAAGSVVTKSIPCDEIWGGNPARFIKKNGHDS